MTKRELEEFIESGESSTIEYKRKLSKTKKIAKEISAFSNSKGGTLIVGIDDDGTIYGVKSEKTEADIIERACGFDLEPPVTPKIEYFNVMGFELVIASIEESNNKPVNLLSKNEQGQILKRAYIRVGEKSVMASSEMARALKHQNRTNRNSLKLSIGSKEKSLLNYLDNYERATVKDFAKLVNISKRRAERLMIRLMRAGILQIHYDNSHDYFTLK